MIKIIPLLALPPQLPRQPCGNGIFTVVVVAAAVMVAIAMTVAIILASVASVAEETSQASAESGIAPFSWYTKHGILNAIEAPGVVVICEIVEHVTNISTAPSPSVVVVEVVTTIQFAAASPPGAPLGHELIHHLKVMSPENAVS